MSDPSPTTFEPVLTAPQIMRRFLGTLRDVLIRPQVFFRRLPLNGRWVHALTSAIVLQWFVAAVTFLGGSSQSWLFSRFNFPSEEVSSKFQFWFSGLGALALSPFQTIISLVSAALVAQFGLWILVGRGRFETLFTLLTYCSFATVFKVIPIVGESVAFIWATVITTIAVRETFRTTTFRGFLVAVFPILLSAVLLFLFGWFLLVLILGGGFALLSQFS